MSERMEVARNVAEHLFATEKAIDSAIACAAGLVGYMPVARQAVRVSAAVGQPAFEQAIASMTMLSEARRHIVETHKSLAQSGEDARVPARNFGGFVDKPCHRAEADLRIVANRQAG